MKFLHLTDIHFLMNYPEVEDGYLSIFNKMTHPMEQLKKGLSMVEDFDAVLISGDLVEEGCKEDYIQLKKELRDLLGDTPIIITLGNHDIKPAFYEGWLSQPPSDEPYNKCVVINDTTIISLDNSHKHYPDGIIDANQCQWLQETLDKCQTKQIILMMHHHLIKEQIELPQAQYEHRFLDIIMNSKIDMIICGHTHHAYEGTFAGKPYFTADNLSFSGEGTPYGYVRFEERSGFNYCELTNNQIKVITIPIEQNQRFLANVTF